MMITTDSKVKLAEGFKGDDTNLEYIDFTFMATSTICKE